MGHVGVDVSSNNQHPIDWHGAFASLFAQGGGQPFVWIKATDGTGYVNPGYRQDRSDAAAAGFAVASYHFDQGGADPAAQIRFYLSVDPAGPWALDFESPQGNYSAHCKAMADLLPSAADYTYVGLRRGFGWATAHLMWLSDPSNVGTDIPRSTQQFAPRTVPGFTGLVDFNVWQGSEPDFARYFHNPPAAAHLQGEPVFVRKSNGAIIWADPTLHAVTGDEWAAIGNAYKAQAPGQPVVVDHDGLFDALYAAGTAAEPEGAPGAPATSQGAPGGLSTADKDDIAARVLAMFQKHPLSPAV